SAVLQTGRNTRDVAVGIAILVIRAGGVWILNRLVGNIKHGNDDAAVLQRLAGRRTASGNHGGVVASRPTASVDRLDLGILCAVRHDEDVGQRAVRGAAVADAGDRGVHR